MPGIVADYVKKQEALRVVPSPVPEAQYQQEAESLLRQGTEPAHEQRGHGRYPFYERDYRIGYEDLQNNLPVLFHRNYEPTRENLNQFATSIYREVTEEHQRHASGLWPTSIAEPPWLDGAHQAILDFHAVKSQELAKNLPAHEQDFGVSL